MDILKIELRNKIKEETIPAFLTVKFFESIMKKENIEIGKSLNEEVYKDGWKYSFNFQNYGNSNQCQRNQICNLYEAQLQPMGINMNNNAQPEEVEENVEEEICEKSPAELKLEEQKKLILNNMKIKEEQRKKQKALYEEELKKREEKRLEEKEKALKITGYKECPIKERKSRVKKSSKTSKKSSEHSTPKQEEISETNLQVNNEPDELRTSLSEIQKSDSQMKANENEVERLSKVKSNQEETDKEPVMITEDQPKPIENLIPSDEERVSKKEASISESKKESIKKPKEVAKKPTYQRPQKVTMTQNSDRSLKSKRFENSRDLKPKNKNQYQNKGRGPMKKKTDNQHKDLVPKEPERAISVTLDEDAQRNSISASERKSINNKNSAACCKTDVKTKKMELEKENGPDENEQTERKDLGDINIETKVKNA